MNTLERILDGLEAIILAILLIIMVVGAAYLTYYWMKPQPKVTEVSNVKFCQHPTVQAIYLAC